MYLYAFLSVLGVFFNKNAFDCQKSEKLSLCPVS